MEEAKDRPLAAPMEGIPLAETSPMISCSTATTEDAVSSSFTSHEVPPSKGEEPISLSDESSIGNNPVSMECISVQEAALVKETVPVQNVNPIREHIPVQSENIAGITGQSTVSNTAHHSPSIPATSKAPPSPMSLLTQNEQVIAGLNVAFNHFQTTLMSSQWKIISDCSAHLHYLMVNDIATRWATIAQSLKLKLLLSIVGIYRKRFKEDNMRHAALRLIKKALDDQDRNVRFLASLIQTIPNISDALMTDMNTCVGIIPEMKAIIDDISTTLHATQNQFYPDEFKFLDYQVITELCGKTIAELFPVSDIKLKPNVGHAGEDVRLKKYRDAAAVKASAAAATPTDPRDILNFMKRPRSRLSGPSFLRTASNVNLQRSGPLSNGPPSSTAKTYQKVSKIKMMDDKEIESIQRELEEKNQDMLRKKRELEDKRLSAMKEKEDRRLERLSRQRELEDNDNESHREAKSQKIKGGKLEQVNDIDSISPSSRKATENDHPSSALILENPKSSRPKRLRGQHSNDVEEPSTKKKSTELTAHMISAAEEERQVAFRKIVPNEEECNSLTLENKNKIIEFLFGGVGHEALEIELSSNIVDIEGIQKREVLMIILDYKERKWKKVKRRMTISV